MKRFKEYQILISAFSLAVALFYVGTTVLLFAMRVGEAVNQHNQIITTQAQLLQLINDKCK